MLALVWFRVWCRPFVVGSSSGRFVGSRIVFVACVGFVSGLGRRGVCFVWLGVGFFFPGLRATSWGFALFCFYACLIPSGCSSSSASADLPP